MVGKANANRFEMLITAGAVKLGQFIAELTHIST